MRIRWTALHGLWLSEQNWIQIKYSYLTRKLWKFTPFETKSAGWKLCKFRHYRTVLKISINQYTMKIAQLSDFIHCTRILRDATKIAQLGWDHRAVSCKIFGHYCKIGLLPHKWLISHWLPNSAKSAEWAHCYIHSVFKYEARK